MKQFAKSSITASLAAALSMVAGSLAAHDEDDAGTPVCTEANYMMADAMNAPFAAANGAGAVIEMNIAPARPVSRFPGRSLRLMWVPTSAHRKSSATFPGGRSVAMVHGNPPACCPAVRTATPLSPAPVSRH